MIKQTEDELRKAHEKSRTNIISTAAYLAIAIRSKSRFRELAERELLEAVDAYEKTYEAWASVAIRGEP